MHRKRTGNTLFFLVLLLSLAVSLTTGCKGDREGTGTADPGTGNGQQQTPPGDTGTVPRDPSPVPGEEDEPDPGTVPDPPPDP